jgi:AraC-like DNA-binding protein
LSPDAESPPQRQRWGGLILKAPRFSFGAPKASHPECRAYARSNVKSDLMVEERADAAHLSPRQFSRAFRAETGQTPAKAVENLRLEAVRLMLEQSRHNARFPAEQFHHLSGSRILDCETAK